MIQGLQSFQSSRVTSFLGLPQVLHCTILSRVRKTERARTIVWGVLGTRCTDMAFFIWHNILSDKVLSSSPKLTARQDEKKSLPLYLAGENGLGELLAKICQTVVKNMYKRVRQPELESLLCLSLVGLIIATSLELTVLLWKLNELIYAEFFEKASHLGGTLWAEMHNPQSSYSNILTPTPKNVTVFGNRSLKM